MITLDLNLEEGEELVAVVVRCADGRLEQRVREPAQEPELTGPGPSFLIPSILVHTGPLGPQGCEIPVQVSIRNMDKIVELDGRLLPIPVDWPMNVEVAALAHVQDGSVVLDEPRCLLCGGTGAAPTAPLGYVGGHCPLCEGTGEYHAPAPAPEPEPAPAPTPKATLPVRRKVVKAPAFEANEPLPTLEDAPLNGEVVLGANTKGEP
jgi:hypothetical protein